MARSRSSSLAIVGWLSFVFACGPTVGTDSDENGGTEGHVPASTSNATGAPGQTTSTTTAPTPEETSTSIMTGTSGGTDSMSLVCDDPQPIMQLGVEGEVPTGFVRCSNGVIHRLKAVECLVPTPSQGECRAYDEKECTVDDDCTDRPYGACWVLPDGFLGRCGCVYGCATDDDCPSGEVCACGGDADGYPRLTQCVPAGCSLDTDCETGHCAIGELVSCSTEYRVACRTHDDLCLTADDCENDDNCFPQLSWWACTDPGTCL